MANYDKQTKYYWLQLKEDFFEEDAISWLEEQENGKEYSLFYLKLCLKSLKTNGIMIRKVGKMLVPYDNKKLSELTNTKIDTVVVAMELLKGIGLIEILENGELYLTQVEEMVGSTSKGAFKKQQQLARRKTKLIEGGQGVENLPPKIKLKDKDKVKDKTKYKDKDIVLVDETSTLPAVIENEVIDINEKSTTQSAMPFTEIINYLNIKCNTNYRASSSKTQTLIKARFNEGYVLEDFYKVIDIKSIEWLKSDMSKYLRPETLFGNKFESYLNQPMKEYTTKDFAKTNEFAQFLEDMRNE